MLKYYGERKERRMGIDDDVYRLLQQHLDNQAVGFPAVSSGADIRILRRLFTRGEARLALHMSYKPAATGAIAGHAAREFSPDETASMLDSMFKKGAIGWKRKDGSDHWFIMPMVVGIYEAQGGIPSSEFLDDADEYMKTLSFGKSFLSVKPSQMRTIPINKSISAEHPVASYDQIQSLVQDVPGPFVVLRCICRTAKSMRNKPCSRTTREETCLAFGDTAAMVLRRGHGREVTRDEVRAILQLNEEDGLVLQPSNSGRPEFVCSCCGCCCGMLSYQKFLPRPTDFWASNFQAEVNPEACSRCGTCVDRCQVKAITLTGRSGEAEVHIQRCIGCGLCVPTCPSAAVKLIKKAAETVPPPNEEALYDEIMANKKGAPEQLRMLLKAALRIKQ
jgi:ferredoxin